MARHRTRLYIIFTAAALLIAGIARAYINPGYTPVNLVEQADYILVVELSEPKDGKVTAKIVRTLKEKKKPPKGPLVIDLTVTALKAHAKAFGEKIKEVGDEPVLFFTGRGENQEDVFLLHMKGRWYSLDATDKPNVFDIFKRDDRMEGTWAGGSDMLLKITELLVKYPDTDVPVASGVKWDEPQKVCNIKGKVTDSRAVDLDGKGRLTLYLACDSGDRLFHFEEKPYKLVEETAKRKLTSKSQAVAWSDFNGDGRLDLLSWNGQGLGMCLQGADGTFAAPKKVEGAPAGKCLGLAVLDSGTPGKVAVIFSGEKGPSLLAPAANGSFSASKLPIDKKVDVAKLGKPGRCLVGDITGDALVDVIWPGTDASVFFKGTAVGKFAPGVACDMAVGRAPGSGFFGDWDMDGRLDVFTVADDGCRLWHNRPGKKPGGFRFEQSVHISGEVAYISKPGGLWGHTCDVNNDGRQDLFWVYSEMPSNGPHIFFNRGFRSFGHAHTLDITERQSIGGVETKGQQHGVVADFTGDAAQDMGVVLANGDFYFFPRMLEAESPLVARVCLPLGGKVVGPVKVTAWNDKVCLGAWNVTAGTSEGFFSQLFAGDVTIKWQLPGSNQVKSRKVTLDEKPVRIVLDAGAKGVPGKTPPKPGKAPAAKPGGSNKEPGKLNLPLIGGIAGGVVLLLIILAIAKKKKAD